MATPATSSTVKLEKSIYKFTWRIPDFDELCPENTTAFGPVTAKFNAGEINDTKLKWRIELSGVKGQIMYDLECLTTQAFEKLHSHFKISIGGPYESAYFTSTEIMSFTAEYPIWNFDECLPISALYEKKDVMLKDNILHVIVIAEIYADPVKFVSSPKRKRESSEELEKVSQDFLNLFESKKYSDVQIKAGDETFFCHKNILSARSPVFNAMFDTDMKESVKNEVVIQELKPQIVQILLKYIYTGKVEMTRGVGQWFKLLHGAEKYDLQELKNICFDKLLTIARKTDEYVAKVTVAAHVYNADEKVRKELRTYCQTHIARLMEKPGFRRLLAYNMPAFYDDEEELTDSDCSDNETVDDDDNETMDDEDEEK